MRPRKLRRVLALMAFGAILAGAGIGWAADVSADNESGWLPAGALVIR
jgi:hypothetical protein